MFKVRFDDKIKTDSIITIMSCQCPLLINKSSKSYFNKVFGIHKCPLPRFLSVTNFPKSFKPIYFGTKKVRAGTAQVALIRLPLPSLAFYNISQFT
jgi:hypothetical protein